jgi:hypothetical protein
MLKSGLAVGLVLTSLTLPALAGTITLVTNRSELNANDSINWGQLPGPTLTIFPTPVGVLSDGGIGATLTTSGGALFKDQQGNPWLGNFASGDYLIGTGQLTPSVPIDVTFARPVSGLGAQFGYDVISTWPFPFTEALIVYDAGHNELASFSVSGLTDNAADNSAVFIGVTDTLDEIASAEFFTPTTAGPFPGAFTINEVSLVEPVPEPGSLALLATALTGFGITRRRTASRRKQHGVAAASFLPESAMSASSGT